MNYCLNRAKNIPIVYFTTLVYDYKIFSSLARNLFPQPPTLLMGWPHYATHINVTHLVTHYPTQRSVNPSSVGIIHSMSERERWKEGGREWDGGMDSLIGGERQRGRFVNVSLWVRTPKSLRVLSLMMSASVLQ